MEKSKEKLFMPSYEDRSVLVSQSDFPKIDGMDKIKILHTSMNRRVVGNPERINWAMLELKIK